MRFRSQKNDFLLLFFGVQQNFDWPTFVAALRKTMIPRHASRNKECDRSIVCHFQRRRTIRHIFNEQHNDPKPIYDKCPNCRYRTHTINTIIDDKRIVPVTDCGNSSKVNLQK